MVRSVVEGTKEEGYVDPSSLDPALLAALADDMAPLRGAGSGVGTRVEILIELGGIKAAICTWHKKMPDQVLREASAYSARLTELWTDLQIAEASDRQMTRLRTMQITPVLAEIDRQAKYAQSRIAMMRQDIDLSR